MCERFRITNREFQTLNLSGGSDGRGGGGGIGGLVGMPVGFLSTG